MSEQKQEEAPKKRGFLSNLFFVDETQVTDKNSSKVNPSVSEPTQQPVVSQPVYTNTANVVGVVNQDIYNNLKQILTECNLPGPDYLELKIAADAMKSYIPDENQRFLVSYASTKATSPKLTKKIVTNSIDEYIKFIEKEKAVFESESKEIFNNEVLARQNKIDGLNGDIEKAKEEIKKLSDKIIALSQEINALGSEKLTKQTELEIKSKNFEVTIDTIINELKSDKLKFETLITE